jgi:hypothetical protein
MRGIGFRKRWPRLVIADKQHMEAIGDGAAALVKAMHHAVDALPLVKSILGVTDFLITSTKVSKQFLTRHEPKYGRADLQI